MSDWIALLTSHICGRTIVILRIDAAASALQCWRLVQGVLSRVQGAWCLVLDAWQAHGGLVTPSSMANSGCESYHCTVLVSLQLKDCLPFSVHSSALHCCVLSGLDTLLSAVHSSTMLPGASAAPGPHCERCCHCTRVAPTHSGGKMTELKILEKR